MELNILIPDFYGREDLPGAVSHIAVIEVNIVIVLTWNDMYLEIGTSGRSERAKLCRKDSQEESLHILARVVCVYVYMYIFIIAFIIKVQ